MREAVANIEAVLNGKLDKGFRYRDLSAEEVTFFKTRTGVDFAGYEWRIIPGALLHENTRTDEKRGWALTDTELKLLPYFIDRLMENKETLAVSIGDVNAKGVRSMVVELENPITKAKMVFEASSKKHTSRPYKTKKAPRLSLSSAKMLLIQRAGLAPASTPKSVPSGEVNLAENGGEVKQNLLKQEFSSRDTSINSNRTPAVYGMVDKMSGWREGTVNIDIGGGKYDTLTQALANKGVTSYIYEPYGRTNNENAYILAQLQSKELQGDTATCSNVLNVIKEADVRDNVVHQVAKSIKPDGVAYFTIYEGNGKGRGAISKNDCWQNNRKTETYVDEVRQHFGDVQMRGKLIIARNPLHAETPAEWRLGAEGGAVSFSVIGRKSRTWDKYVDRAFVGRDDGMWRAEIDASGAKLKWEDLRGKNVAAYRRIVAGWDELPEEIRKKVEAYAEEVYDWQEESDKLNSTPESEFLEQYNKVQKMRDAIKPKREEMRSLLNKLFVEHGGSAGAVLNMKSGELDELVMSLWGPYVESKVEDVLDLRPLWHGGMRLADVMDYPELYEAYPELTDITVRYATMDNANGRALYQDGEKEIAINRNLEGKWEEMHSVLLHEIQHHIQDIEGWAKGGSPAYARRLVDKRAAMGDADAMALRGLSDMELYHRIAGEIEARNVQRRWDWSEEKRAAVPFNDTLEYPGEALVTFSVQRKRDLTLDGERVTQEAAWEHLVELEGKPLRNARSQFVAVVNKPQRKELTDLSKAWKSANNGFSVGAHYAAVGRIEKLFLHAVPCEVYPDSKNGKSDVKILRFACPIMLGGEKAVAWMTAKKSEDKKGSERLYNLELVDIEKLAGKLESVQQSAARFTTDKVTPPPASQKLAGNLENIESENLSTLSPAASPDIVAEVEEAFKTYFEDVPEAGNNFSASLTGAAAAGGGCWRSPAMSMWRTGCRRRGRRIWRSGLCCMTALCKSSPNAVRTG